MLSLPTLVLSLVLSPVDLLENSFLSTRKTPNYNESSVILPMTTTNTGGRSPTGRYGGVCYVIRCDDAVGDSSGTFLQTMKNATDEVAVGEDAPYVKNEEDFLENWYPGASAPGKFIARNPGTWANGIGVAVIDHGADYQVALKKTGIRAEADWFCCCRQHRFRCWYRYRN